MNAQPDPRLNAFRPDLADVRLKGSVEAARFVEPRLRRVNAAVAPLRRQPSPDAPLDTEALYGETVRVFDERDGWAWAQLETDGYVGYLPAAGLAEMGRQPTHRVTAIRTFVYSGPDLKLTPLTALSFGSLIALGEEVVTRGSPYLRLADGSGAISARHVEPLDRPLPSDFVAVASRFLRTPYLWGGRSGFGIDCSGLVQIALGAVGRPVRRDTDMQERTIGAPIPEGVGLHRGDLVFWPGHVGILSDPDTLLHASGYQMEVVEEPLAVARERIAASATQVTSIRRIG